ncbi:MAG: pirin family protein, partial [Planctomycetes bacterium]|nr:pirin family protein [Planctomycetota bacterium]
MIRIRKAEDRGQADHGWLKTSHTFSFADYHDPQNVHFRSLRVMNEDFIAGGNGFGMHPHRDMEIVTYVMQGALEHRDSMGNHGVIKPGVIQRMSAGTGVMHSEQNPTDETTHLYQIWIFPREKGIEPGYEEKSLPETSPGQWVLVASPDGSEGS